MLVLTRKLGESIAIDDHIKIRIVQIKGKQVRLGIEAPKDTKIHREEVYVAIQSQNEESSKASSENTRAVAKLVCGYTPSATQPRKSATPARRLPSAGNTSGNRP